MSIPALCYCRNLNKKNRNDLLPEPVPDLIITVKVALCLNTLHIGTKNFADTIAIKRDAVSGAFFRNI